MTDSACEVFGRYQLLRRLAFGGMAEIFLAALRRDEGFEKKVVLKRILPHLGADDSFVRMFIDEAVLAARVTHPNVVQIYDFGNVDGVYFIAMELVDGVDLRKLVGTGRGKLSAAETAAIGEGVARGLAHAHNLRDDAGDPLHIVHRDVSPHNVMISRAGEIKLMDFGIAKAAARVSRTDAGTIKGKVAYMAPEQATGRAVDKRADQFALGLVLWECLAGERMFGGDSEIGVLQRVAACEVRSLREVRADVPDALERIIARSLALDPEERYPDCADMAADLAGFRFSLGAAGAVELGNLVDEVAPTRQSSGTGRHTLLLTDVIDGDSSADSRGPHDPWGAPSGVGAHVPGFLADRSWRDADATLSATDPAPAGPSPSSSHGVAVSSPLGASLSSMKTADLPRSGSATRSAGVPTGAVGTPASRRHAGAAWIAVGGVALLLVLAASVGGSLVGHQPETVAGTAPASSSTAMVYLESAPPGARILLDGRDTGMRTPAALEEQEIGAPRRVMLRLSGYAPFEQVLIPRLPEERLSVQLRPVPAVSGGAQAEPRVAADRNSAVSRSASSQNAAASGSGGARSDTRRAAPVASAAASSVPSGRGREGADTGHSRPGGRRRGKHEAEADRQPARQGETASAKQETGKLWLRSTSVWFDVYLGDRKLGSTPLSAAVVPAGHLRLRLVNPRVNVEQSLELDVEPGAELRRTVSVR